MRIEVKHIDELQKASKEIVATCKHIPIWLFHGEMGAGKTTLITAICKTLGVTDSISSPTYSIVNEYVADQKKIFHFDCYRIQHPDEALDIGIYEYLDSGQFCFIEWSEKISELIDHTVVSVYISRQENSTTRIIDLKLP
ncbi:MAG: tRNA (adenosine(37)-N6)-threonylcarbamoyltransferase complex ATPase subunit type 1 TsaE [Cyclobacteriaceae bacterium]